MAPVKVLIADDTPQIVRWLELLLGREENIEVVGVAADAKEAVEQTLALEPDVVLLDVMMPHGGGPVAAREISRQAPGTTIIALSARSDAKAVTEMIVEGVSRYISKTTDPDEIVAAVLSAAGLKDRGGQT